MEMPLVTIATHALLPCCSLSLSIEPGDYTATVNTTIMFLVGTYFGGGPGFQRCISIVIEDEDLVELNETFLLTAVSPDPNVNIMNTATVTIINTDGRWLIVVCNLVYPYTHTHTCTHTHTQSQYSGLHKTCLQLVAIETLPWLLS